MIADIILAIFDRRPPVRWNFMHNEARRISYTKRAAEYNAADPDEFLRRFLAGLAVRRRARQGNLKKSNVRPLTRRVA